MAMAAAAAVGAKHGYNKAPFDLGSQDVRIGSQGRVSLTNVQAALAKDLSKGAEDSSKYIMIFGLKFPKDPPGLPVCERAWFKGVIGGTVVLNAIQLGVQMDHPEYEDVYWYSAHFFTSVFTGEMLLKLFEIKLRYFQEGFNILDFVLVWMSIIDTWIFGLIATDSGVDLRQFSVLRILRILQVIRAVRLLRVFRELWKIVKGMMDAVQTIGWAAVLLVLLLYISGIFCCAMVGQNTTAGYYRSIDDVKNPDALDFAADFDAYQYYGTVPRAMFTLFETCIEPLNVRPIIERQPEMLPFFLIFIFLTTFCLMNVIIGAIVEHTLAVSPEDAAREQMEELKKNVEKLDMLRHAVENIDSHSGDGREGTLRLEEVRAAMDSPAVRQVMDDVEMPLGFLPHELFALLDAGGYGEVTSADMMLQLTRATAHTDRQQILDLKIALHATHNFARKGISNLLTNVAEVKGHMSQLELSLSEIKEQMRFGFSKLLSEDAMKDYIKREHLYLKRGASAGSYSCHKESSESSTRASPRDSDSHSSVSLAHQQISSESATRISPGDIDNHSSVSSASRAVHFPGPRSPHIDRPLATGVPVVFGEPPEPATQHAVLHAPRSSNADSGQGGICGGLLPCLATTSLRRDPSPSPKTASTAISIS